MFSSDPAGIPPSAPLTQPADSLPSSPDGFERLWTPHRLAYVRGERCYVVMNLFPYNPGHVLICPYRHASGYVELTAEETLEFSALTKAAIGALSAASAPHGFNVGMNQGDVAGAGVAAHLHQHVVPRWAGDANFLPIIGQTKALPALLEDVRTQLVAAWPTTPGSVPSA